MLKNNTQGIQNGLNTQSQGQVMTLHSFRTIKTIPKGVHNEIEIVFI